MKTYLWCRTECHWAQQNKEVLPKYPAAWAANTAACPTLWDRALQASSVATSAPPLRGFPADIPVAGTNQNHSSTHLEWKRTFSHREDVHKLMLDNSDYHTIELPADVLSNLYNFFADDFLYTRSTIIFTIGL